ncbi:hypothetical protein AMS68_004942 [Peltaster fructicola]|uniref:Extragenic suppressor of kinetochore protein 1 n=1 Tax=Peltaster fructicola TaxID=286661 RepID=A0A6H0XXP1_9PEZI|nr:hypothetical protein AMS68_004942 [Peltaster fructicola]
MFWKFGGFQNLASSIDAALDRPDVTLEELLDDGDLIQELKQQNSKLIEFLRAEPVLHKLLDYVVAQKGIEKVEEKGKDTDNKDNRSGISFFGRAGARDRSKSVSKRDTEDSDHEKQEAQRKKYAYVACEVLSSDVWSITEAVLEQREQLAKFWQYLYQPAPLEPLQAGYFTKVNESLLDKKTEDMIAFIKSLDGVVPAILQHVDCPMVMDLLLKIISLEKHEGGSGVVDWLQRQDLIPSLLHYLSPDHSPATQTAAGDFLKAIITISANATTQDQSVIGPNELTRQLVSAVSIETLITDMLRGGNPLTVGVGIIIEVIRKNNSDYDLDTQISPIPKTSDPIYLGTLLRQFATHVPDFMKLIRSPVAKKPGLKSAFGATVEPLGFDRFKTCELMAELLHCSNMGLLNEPGAEEEVRRRDGERDRLRAAGKLGASAAKPAEAESSHDEFGSSVDSHGFHHAEKPDEETDSKVQNGGDDDGFETVSAPNTEDLPDEVSFDDLNEKTPQPALHKKTGELPHFDPPPTHAADSPTTAGVTDRIGSLDMDEDTVMTEFGEETSHQFDDNGPSELERELAKADRPAPLFSNKAQQKLAPSADTDDTHDIEQSTATIQPDDTIPHDDDDDKAALHNEDDGAPVVGDLLKLSFVDNHVVPTILDFFFRFPWNNFLHNVVYDVVQQVFNGAMERGYNRALAIDLFTPIQTTNGGPLGFSSTKDITDRILDGQTASDKSQKEKNMRLGYMGHLTLIAEEVCKFGSRFPADVLDVNMSSRVNRDEWVQYVDGTLAETRDKDNAVLGGVRPENAMMRPGASGSLQGGFSSNTANALASAGIGTGITEQDSIAMSEGTVGESFEDNSMLKHFAEDEDDLDETEIIRDEERRGSSGSQLSEDEQDNTANASSSIPPPLKIPPSRARRQLAARLAQRKKDAEAAETDPDAADHAALETAAQLPEQPNELDLGPATERELQEVGLQLSGTRTSKGPGSASKFSGLFGSDDSSSDSSLDEDDAGRDETLDRDEDDYEDDAPITFGRRRDDARVRRPSTTEVKERRPLDDDDDDDNDEQQQHTHISKELGSNRGPFADPAEIEDNNSSAEEEGH